MFQLTKLELFSS